MRKIGVCEFCLPVWGVTGIGMAHEAGFEGMQLADCGGMSNNYPFLNDYIRAAYMEAAEENHITFQSQHLHNLFHAHLIDHAPDSALGQSALESIRAGVVSSCLMDIPTVMITINDIKSREQYDNVATALRYAVSLGKHHGVTIAIETDLAPERFAKLRDDVGEEMKLCFDTLNPLTHGMGWAHDVIHEYGIDVIDHFHVKDALKNERGYMTKGTTVTTLLGEGDGGVKQFAKAITQTDFDGWFMAETFYAREIFKGMDYMDLMKKDVKTMREMLP